mgnify:CR=1 FL=1
MLDALASTRPQRLAVEITVHHDNVTGDLLASTRPQRLAVEIVAVLPLGRSAGLASTRPQRLAVEIDAFQSGIEDVLMLQRGHSD